MIFVIEFSEDPFLHEYQLASENTNIQKNPKKTLLFMILQ